MKMDDSLANDLRSRYPAVTSPDVEMLVGDGWYAGVEMALVALARCLQEWKKRHGDARVKVTGINEVGGALSLSVEYSHEGMKKEVDRTIKEGRLYAVENQWCESCGGGGGGGGEVVSNPMSGALERRCPMCRG